jgi:molecular chaperone Hsp33
VQHLAEGEEGRARLHVRLDHPEWEHVTALASSVRHEELVDLALSLEAVAWRLFGAEDEIRVQRLASLARGCRCTEAHYRDVLGQFPEEDRADMRDAEGLVTIDCAFCSKNFRIAA